MNLSLAIAVVVCCMVYQTTASNNLSRSLTCMARVIIRNIFSSDAWCSINQIQSAYSEMRQANCINCDKYFHCKGNYNAVYNCQQSTTNRNIAGAISNCRELGQDSPDSEADQVANAYGRNGSNCDSRYLCEYGCYYDPIIRNCSRAVCEH